MAASIAITQAPSMGAPSASVMLPVTDVTVKANELSSAVVPSVSVKSATSTGVLGARSELAGGIAMTYHGPRGALTENVPSDAMSANDGAMPGSGSNIIT